MFSGDFVKLTSTQNTHGSSDNWTDQEILLLLEGVEMCNNNWSLIEEHVSTHSTQQCIWKFLELAIEDSYLDTEGEEAKGPLRYAQLPFEQADNPVMSVVALLADVVGPGVAAEAAKTATKELTNRKGDEGEKEGEKAEGEKEADKEDHIMGNAECPSTRH